jgi:osmoprotectant transport system permease protein
VSADHVIKSTGERVSLVGIVLGFASFGLRFVQYKPNRIATGEGLYTWQVLTPVQLLLLLLPWVLSLLLLLNLRKPKARASLLPVLDGVVGNLAVLAVFLFIGQVASNLISEEYPYARTSMAFGSWVMIFGGYTLVLSAVQRLRGRRAAVLLVSLSGFAAVVALFSSGLLDELSIVKEFFVNRNRFLDEVGRHLSLSGTAVAAAVVVGVPLGVFAYRKRALEKPIFFSVNTVQTIPSLALFGIMIAPLSLLSQRFPLLRELGVKGIGSAPALIALTLYALLPIVRNTYTSLKVLDPSVVESALGMGMSRFQLLLLVEVPLSLPVILSGIRISMVQAIGNTTVAALIGAGGFGVFVFQGLGQAVPDLILLGALPVILLAVLVDKVMQVIVRAATPEGILLGKEESV